VDDLEQVYRSLSLVSSYHVDYSCSCFLQLFLDYSRPSQRMEVAGVFSLLRLVQRSSFDSKNMNLHDLQEI
jgi:hypothetical protein